MGDRFEDGAATATTEAARASVGASMYEATAAESDKVFELGLVMAGAISAGAYTAGVIDFLIEALDEFDWMKATGKDCVGRDAAGERVAGRPYDGPRHRVKVPMLAGASAGGMTASIAALQLFHTIEHVRPAPAPEPAPEANRLYASWVKAIDLTRLLQQRDLDALDDPGPTDPGAVVKSVLCCEVLDDIVDAAFELGAPVSRPWVGGRWGEDARIVVTVSNVPGVPYRFAMMGADHAADVYGMLDHGDRIGFTVAAGPATGGDPALHLAMTDRPPLPAVTDPSRPRRIDWNADGLRNSPWDLFRRAALGTGAYPIGLAPRVVWRRRPDYEQDAKYRIVERDGTLTPVPPPFGGAAGRGGTYRFPVVDGGTIDNEPLEIARRFLALRRRGVRDEAYDGSARNPRDGAWADAAVVLIDPFPNVVADPDSRPLADWDFGLLASLGSMVSMLIDQARFKPEELQLARDDTVFSRFNITPSRPADDAFAARYPIASGALGGFSGFISESYRRHDYLLGRRNAQAFLRWHLVLPRVNPIFDDPHGRFDAAAPAWWVREPPGDRPAGPAAAAPAFRQVAVRQGEREATTEAIPIIPLSSRLLEEIVLGDADHPFPLSPAAIAVERGDAFQARFARLFERLLEHEIAAYLPLAFRCRWLRRIVAGAVAGVARRRFEEMVRGAVLDVRRAFGR